MVASLLTGSAATLPDSLSGSTSVDVTFLATNGTNFEPICRGVLLGRQVVLNWHCLDDLGNEMHHGKRLVAQRRAERVPIDPAWLTRLPSALKVAQSAGLDFTLFPSPFVADGIATGEVLATRGLRLGDAVELRHDSQIAATCTVDALCGSSFHYGGCSAALRKGWSGSGVWLVDGNMRHLVGLHMQGPDREPNGGARQLSVILGRSSALAGSRLQFSDTFARNPKRRFQWKTTTGQQCGVPSISLAAKPFINDRSRTIQGMALQNSRTLLTSDLFTGKLCRFEWPEGGVPRCWSNPDAQFRRVNGLQKINSRLFALAKSGDGDDASDGSVALVETDGDGNVMRFDPVEIAAPIGAVYRTTSIAGDLVATGSRGLCIVALSSNSRTCDKPADPDGDWRVNGILDLDHTGFLAVGRDFSKRVGYPKCAWYQRIGTRWTLTARCKLTDELKQMSLSFARRSRELQLKAPVLVGKRVIAFGSDGSAYLLAPNAAPRQIAIEGIYESPFRLEDAVRDAQSIDRDHILVASSDGAVRILSSSGDEPLSALQATDGGDDSYTAFDLAIWTTQVVATPRWALVRGQDGSVYSLTWERLP